MALVLLIVPKAFSQDKSLLLKSNRGFEVRIEHSNLNSNEMQSVVAKLSETEFKTFNEKRISLLRNAFSVLDRFKWILGAMGEVSNSTQRSFGPQPMISIMNPSEDLVLESSELGPIYRFAKKAIEERLEFINRELWLHAPIVLESNEAAIYMIIAPHGGLAVKTWGRYYSKGLGLSLSYNWQQNKIYIESFHDTEKLIQGLPFQGNLGVNLKLGAGVINRNTKDAQPVRIDYSHGRSSYPPGPFSIEDSTSHLGLGFPLNAGLIPSPLDGAMGLQNSLERTVYFSKSIEIPGIKTQSPLAYCSLLLKKIFRK